MLFVHENWTNPTLHLYEKMKERAETRNLKDLTISPLLSIKTESFLEHCKTLLKMDGSKVLFGAKEL